MEMSGQAIQRWSKAKNPEIPRSRAQNWAGPPKLAQIKGLGANLVFFSVENHPVFGVFYFKWLTMDMGRISITLVFLFQAPAQIRTRFWAKNIVFSKKNYLNKLQTSLNRPKCILTDLRGYQALFLTISIQNLSTQRRWAANNMPKKLILCAKINI